MYDKQEIGRQMETKPRDFYLKSSYNFFPYTCTGPLLYYAITRLPCSSFVLLKKISGLTLSPCLHIRMTGDTKLPVVWVCVSGVCTIAFRNTSDAGLNKKGWTDHQKCDTLQEH